LFGREDLSALLKNNFPDMATQNVYDMNMFVVRLRVSIAKII
jgi:hypothetical protein